MITLNTCSGFTDFMQGVICCLLKSLSLQRRLLQGTQYMSEESAKWFVPQGPVLPTGMEP